MGTLHRYWLTVIRNWWRMHLEAEPPMPPAAAREWRAALEQLDEALRELGGPVAPHEIHRRAMVWEDVEAMVEEMYQQTDVP